MAPHRNMRGTATALVSGGPRFRAAGAAQAALSNERKGQMTSRSAVTTVRRDEGESRGRALVVAELNRRLADSIDLHAQVKVAHWNVKGPHFACACTHCSSSSRWRWRLRIDQIAERAA